jgi:hypothetical protein
LAGIAIPFLKQADKDFKLASGAVQVIVGEFSPPCFGLPSHLSPFTFQYVSVHGLILQIIWKAVLFVPVLGTALRAGFQSSQSASV